MMQAIIKRMYVTIMIVIVVFSVSLLDGQENDESPRQGHASLLPKASRGPLTPKNENLSLVPAPPVIEKRKVLRSITVGIDVDETLDLGDIIAQLNGVFKDLHDKRENNLYNIAKRKFDLVENEKTQHAMKRNKVHVVPDFNYAKGKAYSPFSYYTPVQGFHITLLKQGFIEESEYNQIKHVLVEKIRFAVNQWSNALCEEYRKIDVLVTNLRWPPPAPNNKWIILDCKAASALARFNLLSLINVVQRCFKEVQGKYGQPFKNGKGDDISFDKIDSLDGVALHISLGELKQEHSIEQRPPPNTLYSYLSSNEILELETKFKDITIPTDFKFTVESLDLRASGSKGSLISSEYRFYLDSTQTQCADDTKENGFPSQEQLQPILQ